ncbi:phosphonate C-P lyase system protein PhnH [Ectothiorhodospira mobilis]|uniref:phosphonate C-P lyase system protein PhnH n=1 Tax=Ectothiorhodospira mobilis TaxID=195064 RepID=UPI001EE92A66|nr:phosphonate C-P lyase system protein PhnH [Ectothiorhodospira mobilis]MCG5536800.1 phosphonate C-P lyase system protein PhnH [Ectothiorhodospira mobilis]
MLEPIFTANVQQAVFRDLLQAQSYPGRAVDVGHHAPDVPAYRTVLAALLDAEISLADPVGRLSAEHDWPFLEARAAGTEHADFILVPGDTVHPLEPRLGSLAEPEQSATLILTVNELGGETGDGLRLRGPGVPGERQLHVDGLHPDWLRQRADWNAAFPMGVDIILASQARIAALPRTTHVEVI